VIGRPPSFTGGAQETVAEPSIASAVTLVGTLGVVAVVKVEIAQLLYPVEFCALFLKTYDVPSVRPVIFVEFATPVLISSHVGPV
tara:strand:+ start:101 stop:355 length:255 start_codon:yes stop_codon:yes gene_type:complete